MPREYVPLDPKDPQPEANPEQTTSIFALTTYTFLDKYIFQAYRQGHLDFEQLPVLGDYDYTKNLVKRSFKHLDMFSGAPNQHMFLALMKVFCESLSPFYSYIHNLRDTSSLGICSAIAYDDLPCLDRLPCACRHQPPSQVSARQTSCINTSADTS